MRARRWNILWLACGIGLYFFPVLQIPLRQESRCAAPPSQLPDRLITPLMLILPTPLLQRLIQVPLICSASCAPFFPPHSLPAAYAISGRFLKHWHLYMHTKGRSPFAPLRTAHYILFYCFCSLFYYWRCDSPLLRRPLVILPYHTLATTSPVI